MNSYEGDMGMAVPGCSPAMIPPPPPPPTGQVPALRINTVEGAGRRAAQPAGSSNGVYEPPAAIQNAMMTKDKKPFTYTPGMGGKLDLSQIRSPRMARRVAKNANDEGIEGPPKTEPKPPSALAAAQPTGLFVQPQVAVPVFPTGPPPVQPPTNRMTNYANRPVNNEPPKPAVDLKPLNDIKLMTTTPSRNVIQPEIPASGFYPNSPPPYVNRSQPNAGEKQQQENGRTVTRVETKVAPITIIPSTPSSPESPSTPTQVTLQKAPTPWLQNKNKQQEELPEWARRAPANNKSSHQNIVLDNSPSAVMQNNTQAQRTCSPPYQNQQPRQYTPQHQQERMIPISIEDRPSVFDVKGEQGHHQLKNSNAQQQKRWGQSQSPQSQQIPSQSQHQSAGTYIVPIAMEGKESRPTITPSSPQPWGRVNNPIDQAHVARVNAPRGAQVYVPQSPEPGPVQSRSFRVLQKITDTDPDMEPGEQLRKLQLTEDDKYLMNKFKEQVDGDGTYLHHEEDPRYRGAAIPSKAFRYLQNMTDSGDAPVNSQGARPALNKKQNRNSKSFEESQANLPPSEQQVYEPKKYTGSAIPSRSFKMLQAMTAPESIGPDVTDY